MPVLKRSLLSARPPCCDADGGGAPVGLGTVGPGARCVDLAVLLSLLPCRPLLPVLLVSCRIATHTCGTVFSEGRRLRLNLCS